MVICVVIDICMVVQLRRTLEEKEKKSESLNQKQNQNKKAENEEAVNKAIKMVVLNSLIGVLFKFPVCFIPLINVCAEFYYKQAFIGDNAITYVTQYSAYLVFHPRFNQFYSMLIDTGFYELIQDISHFLYAFSLSIQMFIYNHYDKKFRKGFDRIRGKNDNSNTKSNNKK